MPTQRDSLLYFANSQLRISENPLNSNSGPEVNNYLASVNVSSPNPWCMAFVYWCHLQAGIVNVPQRGKVIDFYNDALTDGRVFTDISQLQPGDIAFNIQHGSHAGIISNFQDDGTILYISGNTRSTVKNIVSAGDCYVDEHPLAKNIFTVFARYWQ